VNDNAKQIMDHLSKKLVTEPWLKNYEESGTGWLKILSGSMSPFIQTGDQILIKKIEPSRIYLGDIITFWQGNVLVTHRVIKKFIRNSEFYFVEKGDDHANYSLIHARSIIGKVTKINKNGHEVSIDTLMWTVMNRIVGMALCSAYILRLMGRKMPYVPLWFKDILRNLFYVAKMLRDKIIKSIFDSN